MNIYLKYLGLGIISTTLLGQKALVITPVADLVGHPLINNKNTYNKIALDAEKASRPSTCPRLHQILFNEIVDILQETKREARIDISNLYHTQNKHSQPKTTYWTEKKNLIPVSELKKKSLNCNNIPPPIEFNNKNSINSPAIATLIFPWYDPITKQTFSAGTRFKLTRATKEGYYTVYLFDPQNYIFQKSHIPKKKAIISPYRLKNEQKIKLFINLLQQWACQQKGFIPYVWGGISFIDLYTKDSFYKKETNGKTYFHRSEHATFPKTGFDCTGVIARAAQICALPYFYKNSTTASNNLTPLQKNDVITPGDCIIIPGHIMVISSVKNNKLIEAGGYKYGWGKLHEVTLDKIFKKIKTYDQLKEAFFNKKPLCRLKKDGTICSTVTNYKILKLSTVYE